MVTVLRRPHKVVLNVINAVGTLAIFRHQDDIVPEGAKALRLKAKALDLANGSKFFTLSERPKTTSRFLEAMHDE